MDANGLEKILKDYEKPLRKTGGRRIDSAELNCELPLFYFAITGGTEKLILNLLEERGKAAPGEPVLLIAHPSNNSLPACLETLARLQQDGKQGRIFYLQEEEEESDYKAIKKTTKDLSVYNALQNSKLGVLGAPSDWLVASSPSAEIVKKRWGVELVNIDFSEVWNSLKTPDNNELIKHKTLLRKEADKITEPSENDVKNSVKIYLAFKSVIDKYKLDAVTVRCFDLVSGMEATGCYGLSELTDEGIIAGCEGDIVSAVTMLWVNKLLGKTPWMANPARVDKVGNSLVLAHCTVPKSLLSNYKLRSHFESGKGLAIQGALPKGKVTLIRTGGRNLDKLWIAEGEITSSGNSENLCRTQVSIKLTDGGTVKDLLLSPLGNHIVLVYGRHLKRLNSWRNNIKLFFG
jgi:L-fucose isomerase-like protein